MTALAERLGYGAGARLLIVNCDDLGSSHAANVAIAESIRRGIATSATLMVPCPWAREAAEMCAGLDVGIHLTLTCEYPGYRWRALTAAASLHDQDGFMPKTAAEVWQKADLADIERECRAQIDAALSWGVDVTHLDAHMGTMQIHPAYYDIYVRLAADYRLPLRMVGKTADAALGFSCRDTAAANGIVFTDHFIMPVWRAPTLPQFRDKLAALEPGVSEIFAHPVEDGPELRGYDKEEADTRAGDYVTMFDAGLRALIEENGIVPIGFRPLRDLMRG